MLKTVKDLLKQGFQMSKLALEVRIPDQIQNLYKIQKIGIIIIRISDYRHVKILDLWNQVWPLKPLFRGSCPVFSTGYLYLCYLISGKKFWPYKFLLLEDSDSSYFSSLFGLYGLETSKYGNNDIFDTNLTQKHKKGTFSNMLTPGPLKWPSQPLLAYYIFPAFLDA